jgi:hypothetical protein
MILIKKIPLDQVFQAYPLPSSMLDDYLRYRPGILENPDIFFENYRSQEQAFKNFDLFKETKEDSPATVYICPVYLELYEYAEKSVMDVIAHFSKLLSPWRVIFHWNHDVDFASKYLDAKNFKNAYIINFNTSLPIPNDILVPFWVINTKLITGKKLYRGGFIGTPNNPLRSQLVKTLAGHPEYLLASGLPLQQFLMKTAECEFSFCPRGIGLSSYRFYECFHLDTIPVLIADRSSLPFLPEIDYNDICVRIPEAKVNDLTFIENALNKVDIPKMKERIQAIRHKFSLLGVQEEIHRRLTL